MVVPKKQTHRLVCCAENFNWCTVPKHGQDAVLFVGIALLTACLFSGKFFALAVLLAGALAPNLPGTLLMSLH